MSSNDNIQNSLQVETPEQIESTNMEVPTSNASGIQIVKNGKTYSNNFNTNELIKARDNILSSGLDLKQTKMINILFNRLDPEKISKLINHVLYSKKIIPANDSASAIAINSLSYENGKILNSINGQVLNGPAGVGAYGSDSIHSVQPGSKVNRTHLQLPADNDFALIDIMNQLSNRGGFKCYATENLTKRYDRLVNDQGQLTKGVEKAFDNKGFPVLEAQTALNCYGHDKLCFTKEAIVEMLYLCKANNNVTLDTSGTVTYLTVYDKSFMNARNILPAEATREYAFVSKAQTSDDLAEQIGRILFSNFSKVNVFAPNASLGEMWQSGDYVPDIFDYGAHQINLARANWIKWLARRKNGTNLNFVGYVSNNGNIAGRWGTILSPPNYTDVAGYTSYINDASKFTTDNTTTFTFRFAEPTDEYNVQDIMSAYCYLCNRWGRYSTPYGDVNLTGSTGDNVNTQIFTCPVWNRIGYCLGFLTYELDHTTVFDEHGSLIRNKLYHFTRYYFGLMLTGITKFFGSAENISILMNNPRTSVVATKLYKNLFSMLNFMYFTPDGKDVYFIYPLAKTFSANYSANLLYTLNGVYTPGTLFNDYQNANITGPLSSSTADLSYHVYLEDYQWWRGDIFGGLNELDIRVLRSAGSSLSLIKQASNNNEAIEFDCGYYTSQGCDSCEIDLWSDAYGSIERKKVRVVNWNNTDTVARFVQPLLFIWGGVVTSIRLGGFLTVPTANTFNPLIPMASIANWAELSPNVTSQSAYSPEMDF